MRGGARRCEWYRFRWRPSRWQEALSGEEGTEDNENDDNDPLAA